MTANNQYLILGAATGYNLAAMLPFVVSLKKTGYRGRLCLFVWDLDKQTIKTLRALGAELYPCASDRVDKQYTVTGGRFFIFQDFLRDVASPGTQVMLSDVRDVVFQRNPFEGLDALDTHFFLEQPGYTLGSEAFNARAMTQAYGQETLKVLADKPISCVGVIIGNILSIRSYLDKMSHELERMPQDFFGSDQAAHNHILHAGYVDFAYSLHANDTSRVMHMGLLPSEAVVWDGNNNILNKHGEIVAVLHQYDRHPTATARLLKKIL